MSKFPLPYLADLWRHHEYHLPNRPLVWEAKVNWYTRRGLSVTSVSRHRWLAAVKGYWNLAVYAADLEWRRWRNVEDGPFMGRLWWH